MPDYNRPCTGSIAYNPVNWAIEDCYPSLEPKVKSCLDEAAEKYKAGDIQGCATLLSEMTSMLPGIRPSYYGIAVCLASLGVYPEADRFLSEELRLSPPHRFASQLQQDIRAHLDNDGSTLTIFTIPKPFNSTNTIAQKNAISSWLQLRPRPEIILCGNDEGVAEAAAEFGIQHIPEIVVTRYGSPLVSDVFHKAQTAASHDVIAYVNTDIILFQDFLDSVVRVKEYGFSKFLMIGQRWDSDLSEPIDFNDPGWRQTLEKKTRAAGRLHAATGKDYFVFPKGLWGKMPELVVGRGHWDNWLVFKPLTDAVPVIDASESVFIVHQDHDYSHMPGSNENWLERPECVQNRSLSGYGAWHGHISDATWVLSNGQLRRRFDFGNIHEVIERINDMLNASQIPDAMILAAQLSEQKPNYSDILRRKIESRIGKPVSDNSVPSTSTTAGAQHPVLNRAVVRLYAGDVPQMPEYEGWIGLSLTRSDDRHIQHDITRPLPFSDCSVDNFQAEDVLEHIPYDRLVPVVDEIFRILKPGGLFRLSLPDYGCDVIRGRSIKNASGNILYDPEGGGTIENPGHLWFPRVENVYRLLENTFFKSNGNMKFLQYWNMDNVTYVVKPIDYSKGIVRRTPDFDDRVRHPYRPMSIVVDLRKGE